MDNADLTEAIEHAIAALVRALAAPTPPSAPQTLAALFQVLNAAESARERVEAEDLIWALWYKHPDAELERRMSQAIGLLARRDFDAAESLLDDLVRDAPQWAEVWNKRATLYFLQQRDAPSARDIVRTLALEPRHFGAMSGLGQICLRAGDEASALTAFQAALSINPNLDGLRETVAILLPRVRRTVH